MNDGSLFIGIDLGGTEVKMGLLDAAGACIETTAMKTQCDHGGDRFVRALSKKIKSLAKERVIEGIGIGVPGLIDHDTGTCVTLPNIPGLNGYALGPGLSLECGIRVSVENDVNAMAIGELHYGAGKGYRNIIAVTLGTGVGGGLVIDGKLFRGAACSAGEIGHITIDPNGLLCPCGNYGCVEAYTGRNAIVARTRAYLSRTEAGTVEAFLEEGEITPRAVYRAAQAGDPVGIAVLADTGRYLGIALASLVNVLNPEIIIIGGGVANAGELIFEPLRREIRKRAFTAGRHEPIIAHAGLKNSAGIIGAASIAMEAGEEK